MHLSLLAVSVVHTRGCGPGVAQLPWQLQALALSFPLAFDRKASQQSAAFPHVAPKIHR